MKGFSELSFLPRLRGRRASFKIGVIATLAIAVGANVAVLGNLGVILGRVVPGAAHRTLFAPYISSAQQNVPDSLLGVARPVYDRFSKEIGPHVKVGAYWPYTLSYRNLAGKGGSVSESINFITVTPPLAGVLGIHATAGRLLAAEDTKPGSDRVALVSAAFGRARFGSAASAINQRITLDGTDYRIVGVLPDGLVFPPENPASAWVPLPSEAADKQGKAVTSTDYLGGLKVLVVPTSDWSAARIRTALDRALQQALSQTPATMTAAGKSAGYKATIQSYGQMLYGPIITQLELLELAALLLFLLVLANLVGLATADTLARRHEFAARTALGAGTTRLYVERARKLISLGVIAWAVGIGLGWLGSRALSGTVGHAGAPVALSAPVLLITLAAVLVVTALLAAGGVWRVRAPRNLLADLMSGGHASGSRGLVRTLRTLIALQLAVSVVLLIVAGHFRLNVSTLGSSDLGFNPRHLSFAEASLTGTPAFGNAAKSGASVAMTENDASAAVKQQNTGVFEILSRLRALPGVEGAAVLSTVPLGEGNSLDMTASVEGMPEPGGKSIGLQAVSREIMKTLGMTVLAGDPDAIFRPSSTGIFMDLRSAHEFFPTLSPHQVIGKTLRIMGPGEPEHRIEAVVANLKTDPYTAGKGQVFKAFRNRFLPLAPVFAVRTREQGGALQDAISGVVKAVYPQTQSVKVYSAASVIAKAYAKRIQLGRVFGVLAMVALSIAAVGLFALLAYHALIRRPEFAIRAALGATPGRLFGKVLGEATALWMIACVIGVPAAYGISVLLDSRLPRLGLPAAWVAVAVVVTIGITALVAAVIPARRAAGTDLSGNLSG